MFTISNSTVHRSDKTSQSKALFLVAYGLRYPLNTQAEFSYDRLLPQDDQGFGVFFFSFTKNNLVVTRNKMKRKHYLAFKTFRNLFFNLPFAAVT